MAIGALQVGSYTNKTASGNIKSGQGALLGFYVNSTSSGTITLYDDAATGTTTAISGTITPAIGWHNYPVCFANGLNIVIANTLNVTLVWV